jgi:hypothetical protein
MTKSRRICGAFLTASRPTLGSYGASALVASFLWVVLPACNSDAAGSEDSNALAGGNSSIGVGGRSQNGVGGELDVAAGGFIPSGGGPVNGVGGLATGGLGETGGAGGSSLDTSEEAGPCGQFVGDLDKFCESNECVVDQLPDCESVAQSQTVSPPTLRKGCGLVELTTPIGEGDAATTIYEESTKTLVYYGTIGALAIGCNPRGSRYGERQVCDDWMDACPSTGEGGSTGTP